MTRTQACFKISDTAKRPRASPPAALPWSLQATLRVPFGQAVQIEITGQLQRKRKYDEWEQIQCDTQVDGKTARQVLADYHGPDRILDIQLPPKLQNESESEPPQQANTFTDASVLLPRIPWTACAGIGIVHIDRDLIADPIHTIEAELTETRSDPTRRYSTVSSAINNSARMELTAAIIATYAPRPITIAIDIKDGRSRPSHWINRLDGDLWVFWERVITASGANTIHVKWIPGHQTQQDEDKGRISRQDRRGNHLADELAGHASQNHNESMAKYAQETVKRNDEYRKLVHWIHKHMLRVTNRLAQTEHRIACTAATRKKPHIATFTFHKQQDRTTRTISFLRDLPPTRYNQHKDICQALIYYLQKMEIVDENTADQEENRLMPIELMVDFETSTGHNFPESLKTYVQDQSQRHNPRLTSVIRVMNRMIRDIATHIVHPEDRAIFSISNTALNNATKYAIAKTKKQLAYGFTAKFGRDRCSTIAKHIAKQIHDIEIHSFDYETLEPFIVTRKSGMHPTRMEWRQQANGRKASAPEAATSYTVLCPTKCGTQTDIRTKPMRQQTGWPIMVCHGCGKEHSTRTATCRRCRIVTHKCKCPATNTKAHSQQQQSKNRL